MGTGCARPIPNAIIQYAAPGDGTIRSWAVQLPPETLDERQEFEDRAAYLPRLGLEIIRADLERFMLQPHQDLLERSF